MSEADRHLEAVDADGSLITLANGQQRRVHRIRTHHARAILDAPWLEVHDDLRDTIELIATRHIVSITTL